MNCKHHPLPAASRAAFTLAEVLAAMLFMAIVIPVAVQGLRVAHQAGEVGLRKNAATRVGERVLNELLVTGQLQGGSQSGVTREGTLDYRWRLVSQPWTLENMQLVTIQVFFPVRGREYDIYLSTLLENATSL